MVKNTRTKDGFVKIPVWVTRDKMPVGRGRVISIFLEKPYLDPGTGMYIGNECLFTFDTVQEAKKKIGIESIPSPGERYDGILHMKVEGG